MKVSIPSYLNKEFVIDDDRAVIRNPKNISRSLKFKAGDLLPPGKVIGDTKLLPLLTRVKITDVRTDDNRIAYAYAEPIDCPDFMPSGWTRFSNILGKLYNETIGYLPSEWDLTPMGDNYTVTDKKALIREGKPDYKSTGELIPLGTYVEVTARSQETDKKPAGFYVRVRHATIIEGEIVAGDPIGWTAASNLADGFSQVFKSEEWANRLGDNAAWRKGQFIGSKVLVGIIGTGGQLQRIALSTLEPYLDLMEAARKDNITLSITSGFRTYAKQQKLYDWWEADKVNHNRAAKAGRSNHQNGLAFDLNTGGFDGHPVYDWLKKNATTYGFIRTVNKEHWHWEYHPDLALTFKKEGKFKLDRVTT